MTKRKIIGIYILFFLLGIVLAYGYGLYSQYQDTLSKMHVKEDAESGMNPESSKKGEEPFAFLLFGLAEASPPDTFILALIDAERQKVQLISIPRDSYVDIPGYRKDKINSAYSKGGAALLRKTLEDWLDLKIAGYAAINYQGFIDLVDIVEGLDVNVSRDMEYDDPINGTHINLKKGQQVLNGKKALDFVRFRQSNDGNHATDYDRMERQQTALKILADKLISMKSLTRYQGILDILSNNIKTTLTAEEMHLLIRKFYSFDINNLQTSSIMGESIYLDKVWYEQIPDEELQRIKELITDFIQQGGLR